MGGLSLALRGRGVERQVALAPVDYAEGRLDFQGRVLEKETRDRIALCFVPVSAR